MGAYGSPDVAVAGLLEGFPNLVDSAIAQEDIAYGSPVFGFEGKENVAWGAHKEQTLLTLSADLIAANKYTVTVGGIAIAETFATDHATTMTALIAAINASVPIKAMNVIAVAVGTRGIAITAGAGGTTVLVSGVVASGLSQPDVAVEVGTAGKFLGVAVFVQNGGATWGAETACWKNKSPINILREGKIYVPVEASVKDKQKAYAVMAGSGTIGKFTDVATSNYDIGAFFRSNVHGGLALLEVRGMK